MTGFKELFHAFVLLLAHGLTFFYGYTHNYGLAIILLTIAIRIVLVPFMWSQIRSTRVMQLVEPERRALEKKYKNDKQQYNRAVMELWQSHGYNPFSGCLPLLLQLPFLYALFYAIRDYPYQGPTNFLWIHSLAVPDPVLLPLLTVGLTYWQTRVSTVMVDQSQQLMLYAVPLVFGWMTTRFPAGLALYWVVSTATFVIQQYLVPQPRLTSGGGQATPS